MHLSKWYCVTSEERNKEKRKNPESPSKRNKCSCWCKFLCNNEYQHGYDDDVNRYLVIGCIYKM